MFTAPASTYYQPAPGQSEFATARQMRYLEYRYAYQGWQWTTEPAPGERRLTVNYLRVFVHKAASYLFSHPVGYEATVDAAPGRTKKAQTTAAAGVEDYLRQVGEFNAWPLLDLETGILAAVLGDGAWTVRWDPAAKLPRTTLIDPATLDCRWRQDDLTTLLEVRQSYWLQPEELTPDQAARLASPPTGPLQAVETWTPRTWTLTVGSTPIDGGANPYGVIPYIVFPNSRVPGEFWGEGDLVDLLALQRELNGRLSIFSRILDVSGSPVTVVEGVDDTTGLRVGPGQMWPLPEGAKAYILDMMKAGITDAHMQYLDKIYRALHDLAEMPRTAFGDSSSSRGSSGARSGRAMEIELQPLLHKIERKRAILTAALVRRAQLCLLLARTHGTALPEVRLSLVWAPVLPTDREALVQQESVLVGRGIHPPTRAMELLSDEDPAELFQRVLAEATALTAAGFNLGGGGGFGSSGSGGSSSSSGA